MALQPNLSKRSWNGSRRPHHWAHDYDPFADDLSTSTLEQAPASTVPDKGASPCKLCKGKGVVDECDVEGSHYLSPCDCPAGLEDEEALLAFQQELAWAWASEVSA